jgi:hypothetical protein
LLTKAVAAMMKSKGFPNIVAYLDDFIVADRSFDRCLYALNTLIRLLRKLGFDINYGKVDGPSRKLTFLGINIDTENMTLGLPAEKLQRLYALIDGTLSKKWATKRELQSIVGKLLWASHVVGGARSFLRQMIDTTCTLKAAWHKAYISAAVTYDLSFWKHVLLPLAAGSLPILITEQLYQYAW